MRIFVLAESTLLAVGDVGAMVAAVQKQLSDDFCGPWESYTTISYAPDAASIPAGDDVTIAHIIDDEPNADALGDHYEDGLGRRVIRVAVRPVLDAGGSALGTSRTEGGVSAVLSHEALETAVDPDTISWWQRPDGLLIAAEVADPVESDSYAVHLEQFDRDVWVSNFIRPEWIRAGVGRRYDHMMTLTEPWKMSAGGYWIQMEAGGEPQAVFGEAVPVVKQEAKLARTRKRMGRGARRGVSGYR